MHFQAGHLGRRLTLLPTRITGQQQHNTEQAINSIDQPHNVFGHGWNSVFCVILPCVQHTYDNGPYATTSFRATVSKSP